VVAPLYLKWATFAVASTIYMPKTTPFHSRLAPLNETMIWENWAGYLSAPRYQYSEITEYYATRNAAGVFDTSPLFKYKFTGAAVTDYLARVMARDIRQCKVGQAQYTVWCNAKGFVVEDGVILHVAENEYWLTTAEPNYRYFRNLINGMDVQIEDISAEYGILAVQGPHSISVLAQLTEDAGNLRYFDVVQTKIANIPVTVSRTGFTGDLGYEIWVAPDNAIALWDALFAAGEGYTIKALGLHALKMARIEAGLLLLDVDFHSARYAWVDAERETPLELGWSWMFRNLAKDDRDFIGRSAIESELNNGTSRWLTVGLAVDYLAYEGIYRNAGIMPPKEGLMIESTMSLYKPNTNWEYLGYASSFLYSSLLKKHIAIAKLPPEYAKLGTEVDLEISVIRKPEYVLARVVPIPFYNPARKTARQPS
jgi:aminomethyltransferase